MAEYWGFDQIDTEGLIFTSYNSLDWRTVAPVALELRKMGVPIWYDYGLEAGTQGWRTQISIHIGKASAIVLFVTKGIFERKESYVIIEYLEAKRLGIPVVPVFLDDVSEEAFFRAMNAKYRSYVVEWEDREGLAYSPDATPESLARAIKHRLNSSTHITYDSVPWIDRQVEREEKAEAARVVARLEAEVEEKVKEAEKSAKKSDNTEVRIGSLVAFGNYPQSSNTPEPIMWRVLNIFDDKALLISESLLDCVRYNESFESVTWETCTLRKWLNREFRNWAFSHEERNKLSRVTIANPDNPSYGTKGGNPTDDYVFCLSIDEAKRYFSCDDDRKAKPTAYARKNGCYVNSDFGTAWWWLRSPGNGGSGAASVGTHGLIGGSGCVNNDRSCVRPVILVKL